MAKRFPQLSIRIDFDGGRLGPGKVELLEHIARERSIAAAARAMGMSYKRAWQLVDTLNALLREPVVVTMPGRNVAGASEVTAFGHRIVALYRASTVAAARAAEDALKELAAVTRPPATRTAAARSTRAAPRSKSRSRRRARPT